MQTSINVVEAVVLGVVQGLTEFLPISSSGHVEVAKKLMGLYIEDNLLFSVVLHLATALSTIIVFWKYVNNMLGSLVTFKWNDSTKLALKIILANVPLAIAGIAFRDYIDIIFKRNFELIGIMFITNGFFLALASHFRIQEDRKLNFFHALIIGCTQVIAIIPGISRSGFTLSTSYLLGASKKEGIIFSYLMIVGPIFYTAYIELRRFLASPVSPNEVGLLPLSIGAFTAFTVGFLTCNLMVKIISRKSLMYFSFYCTIIGALMVILLVMEIYE